MSRRNNLFSLSQECLKPNVQFYHLTPKSYDVKQIFAGKRCQNGNSYHGKLKRMLKLISHVEFSFHNFIINSGYFSEVEIWQVSGEKAIKMLKLNITLVLYGKLACYS